LRDHMPTLLTPPGLGRQVPYTPEMQRFRAGRKSAHLSTKLRAQEPAMGSALRRLFEVRRSY
jgi:hypothetical protein